MDGAMGDAKPTRIVIQDGVDSLCEQMAKDFADIANRVIERNGLMTLALSGGSTPKSLHASLSSQGIRESVDWTKVHFYWGDERTVPPDHEDSNYRMARETLLTPLGVKKEQVHRVHTELGDWEKAAQQYQRQIAETFGVAINGPPPIFDLVVLGIGGDGHTASLFPNTQALQETSRWIVANEVPQMETHRITMTAPLINKAKHVWFMATGDSKAERVAEVINGPSDANRLPSQLIKPTHGQLTWYLDRGAAALLT